MGTEHEQQTLRHVLSGAGGIVGGGRPEPSANPLPFRCGGVRARPPAHSLAPPRTDPARR